MLVLILVLLCVVFTTYDRYGFTTDEDRGLLRAERNLSQSSPSGRVRRPPDIDLFHGAAPDVIASLLQKSFPTLSYDSRSSRLAVFGFAGVYLRLRLCAADGSVS